MKFKMILYLLLFALFIGGAYYAYDALAEKGTNSNLQFVEDGEKQPSKDEEGKPSGSPQQPPAEQAPPAQQPPAEETPPAEQAPPAQQDPPAEEKPPSENPPSENPPPEDETMPNEQEQKPPEALPVPPKPQPTVKDFTVYDESGKAVKLSEHFGRPIVINFFASWCGPCRSEMPYFQTHYIANRGEIDFLFISLDSSLAAATKFVRGQGYTFPILHDRLGNAAAAYDVGAIPATYFINAEGELVAWAVGAMSYADISRAIAKIK